MALSQEEYLKLYRTSKKNYKIEQDYKERMKKESLKPKEPPKPYTDEQIQSGLEQSKVRGMGLSGVQGIVKGLSYGLDTGETTPEKKRIFEMAKKEYPKTHFAGEMIGAFASPISRLIGLAGKGIGAIAGKFGSKGAPKVTESAMKVMNKPVTKMASGGALDLGAYSGLTEAGEQKRAGEGYDIGKIATETGKGATLGAGGGVALGMAGKGVSKLWNRYRGKTPTTPTGTPVTESPIMNTGKRFSVKPIQKTVQETVETPVAKIGVKKIKPKKLSYKNEDIKDKLIDFKSQKDIERTFKGIVRKGDLSTDDLKKMKAELIEEKGKAFTEQIEYMKRGKGKKPNQGALHRDAEGTVVGRSGRTSNNDLWYQKWAKENRIWNDTKKKWDYPKISDKEMKKLAEQQLRKGSVSSVGKIPKNEFYINADNQIKAIDKITSKTKKKTVTKAIPVTKVKSTRKVQDLSKMTRDEVDELYKTSSIKGSGQFKLDNMLEDVGARVINRTGSNNVDDVLNIYKKKYGFDSKIKVKVQKIGTNGKFDKKTNTILIKEGMTPEKTMGVLRHEIEHAIDMKRGFIGATEKVPSPSWQKGKTAKQIYEKMQEVGHEKYKWFDRDYLHRAMVKDALKRGDKLPESVMKEFGDLVGTKVTAPVTKKATSRLIPKKIASQESKRVSKKTGEPIKRVIPKKETTQTTQTTGKERKRSYTNRFDEQVNATDKAKERVKTSKAVEKVYNQKADKTVIDQAEKLFYADKDKAYRDLASRLKKTTENEYDVDVVLGTYIQNDLYARGLMKEGDELVNLLSERAIAQGRAVHAHNIIKKSTPTGYMAHIDKQVSKINKWGAEKYGDKWNKVKVDSKMRKDILNSREISDDLIESTANSINEQLPITFAEKVSAYRRVSMLLNPKTHIRNILGNSLMFGLRKGTNQVAEQLEKFIPQNLRTKASGWSKDSALKNEVTDTFNKVQTALRKGGRWDIASDVGLEQVGHRQIFKGKWMNEADKLNFKLLEKGDLIFLENAFKDSLGQFMKARGLKKATDEAIDYATERAYKATFRDNTLLSNLIGTLKKKGGVIGQIAEIGVPFVKTPGAIMQRGIDYSPLAFLNILYKGFTNKAYKGSANFIEDIAQGMTGSGVLGLGYFMASAGYAKVAGSEKGKGYQISQEVGDQKFSFTTPWGSFTFDWMQPIAIPFAVGVSMQEAIAKNLDPEKGLAWGKIMGRALDDGFGTIENVTILKFFTNLLSGQKSTSETLMDIPANFVQQLIPTMLGQLSKTIDPYKRETYDPTYTKRLGKQIIAKTPFSKTLQAKRDIFGNKVEQTSLNPVVRGVFQFIMPSYYLQKSNDKTTQELSRIYKTTKDTEFLPRQAPRSIPTESGTRYLTTEEINKFQEEMGKKNYEFMSKFVNSSDYQKYSDTERRKIFTKTAKKNYDQAKEEFTTGKSKKEKRIARRNTRNTNKIISKGEKKGYVPK